MKKKIIIIAPVVLIIILLFFSYHSILFHYKFNGLITKMSPQIKACLKQHEEVFIGSLEEKAHSQGKNIFVKDEKRAIEILEKIDLNKLTVHEDFLFGKILLENCNSYNISKFLELDRKRISCRKIFDEYHFYKALLDAVKKQRWSKKTKAKAIEAVYSFITHQTEHKAPLINQLVSISILKLMVEEKLIERKHLSLIQSLHVNSERDSLRLRGAYRKLMSQDQSISCENYNRYKIIEEKITTDIAEQITSTIKTIKD